MRAPFTGKKLIQFIFGSKVEKKKKKNKNNKSINFDQSPGIQA